MNRKKQLVKNVRMNYKKFVILLFMLCGLSSIAQNVETLPLDFDNPMDVEFRKINDDFQYMVVAERAGKVWLCQLVDGEWIKNSQPLIDITSQVNTYFERGVQSIVVTDNFIHMYYTVKFGFDEQTVTFNRVSRWEIAWTNNFALSEDIIIGQTPEDGIPSIAGNHQGGAMVLSNGFLYVSTGDGSSGIYDEQAEQAGIQDPNLTGLDGTRKAQTISSANGKILRVTDFSGNGASGNPFWDSANRRTPESRMYALGFRNPFEMCVDANGNIIVADVGAGQREEITVLPANITGLNAGWGRYEGFSTFSNSILNDTNPYTGETYIINPSTSLTPSTDLNVRINTHLLPSIDYGHNGNFETRLANIPSPLIDNNGIEGNSITGGDVITTDAFGPELNGAYVFSDYTRGWLNVAVPTNDTGGRYFDYTFQMLPVDTFCCPVDITEGPDGNLYVVNLFSTSIQVVEPDNTLGIDSYEKEKNSIVYYNTNWLSIDTPTSIYNNLGQKILEVTNSGYITLPSDGLYIAINENNSILKFMYKN
jgi:glucose/arabinose dehydrogenase